MPYSESAVYCKLFFQSDSENEKEILLKSWWTEHAETEQRLPMPGSLTRINHSGQHRIPGFRTEPLNSALKLPLRPGPKLIKRRNTFDEPPT